MGLFGNLFSRGGSAVTDEEWAVWQPTGDEPDITPAYLMDDDGCAGENAYGVTFTLADAPGATITIWTYPCYGPADVPDSFVIGYRCEYRFDSGSDSEPWTSYEYTDDAEWYWTLDDCDAACQEDARNMATTDRSQPDDGPSPEWEQLFDWDGVPL